MYLKCFVYNRLSTKRSYLSVIILYNLDFYTTTPFKFGGAYPKTWVDEMHLMSFWGNSVSCVLFYPIRS